jgi:Aminotransferase class-V
VALIDKREFVGLDGVAHLCTGGEAPWLRSHTTTCERFGTLKSGGMAGREEMFAIGERARAGAARVLGIAPAEVAFLAHSSEGLNQAVRSVERRAGDNVVFADLEYPSSIYPAAMLRERGVEARVVRTRAHYLSLDDLAALVDRRMRLRRLELLQVAARHPRRRPLRLQRPPRRGAGAGHRRLAHRPWVTHRGAPLTGDTALRLGHFFGTSAEFWLNLQSLYEVRVAERAVGRQISRLPVLERQTA